LPPAILANRSQVHKEKKNFFIGRVEKDVASPLPLGEELYDVVLQYDDIVYSFQSDTSLITWSSNFTTKIIQLLKSQEIRFDRSVTK